MSRFSPDSEVVKTAKAILYTPLSSDYNPLYSIDYYEKNLAILHAHIMKRIVRNHPKIPNEEIPVLFFLQIYLSTGFFIK